MRLLPACFLAYCCLGNIAALAQAPPELPHYQSPSEAFDAFRRAYAKQEWHDAYRCLSEDALKDSVFESYFNCSMALGERRRDIAKLLKQYGVESHVVDAEYAKRQIEKPAGAARRTDNDTRQILQEILFDLLDDEREFCAAVQKLQARPDAIPVFGPLEQVQVNGDHAEGRAQTTRYVFMSENGGPMQRKEHKKLETYRFRKVGESWFIDP